MSKKSYKRSINNKNKGIKGKVIWTGSMYSIMHNKSVVCLTKIIYAILASLLIIGSINMIIDK